MQNEKRALICLDGEAPSKKTIDGALQEVDFLIAADGAANWLVDYGIAPDVLIGDLDGVKKSTLKKLPSTQIIQKKDQYSTDLEKAFTWAIQNKFQNVMVLAAAGKRLDHTLSNFALMWSFSKKCLIEVQHDDWKAYLLTNDKEEFIVKKGMTVSLVPYSHCTGITLKGFKYSLTNSKMNVGEVGVSNVASRSKVSIHVRSGKMLAMFLSKVS